MSTEPIIERQHVGTPNAEFLLRVPPGLAYFRGHFPAAPIVPGVVQIKWAVELAARHLGVAGTFAGMEALKFQQVMRPGVAVRLSLRWAERDHKLHFAYEADGARFGSGRLRFR